MKILDRLPYHDRPTLLDFHGGTVDVRAFQIVIWIRLSRLMFPAVLDTGHSHNMSIPERQLLSWAGVDSLEEIGQVEVNRIMVSQFAADVRIHRNRPGTRQPIEPAYLLTMDEGITVVPEGTAASPRLPVLGLRGITRNGLKLIIDGRRREVTLKTPGWFG